MMQDVVSAEEEWRTHPKRGQRSHGRACLWIKLACGHYPQQRMVPLNREGTFTMPKRVRCDDCIPGRKTTTPSG